MVSLGTIISGLSLAATVRQRQQTEGEQKAEQTQARNQDVETMHNDPSQAAEASARELRNLREIAEATKPTAASVDAYVGETTSLTVGQTAVLEITPKRGYTLKVKRVEMDRRDDHEYAIIIDGEQFSGTHRAEFHRPRTVRYGGKVLLEVTNNSASTSTVDFEHEGWSIPAGGN